MEPVIIAVQASDDRLPDFYDPLASRLEGRGALYVPHVVIPPNARTVVRRPPTLVVGLSSPDDVGELEAWAAEYLAPEEASELHFQREGRRVVLRAADPEASRESLTPLVSE